MSLIDPMNSYRARRATTDDLEQLIALWREAQFPAQELEKRFTDFQVVEDGQGKILGAIGITISAHEAKIHSETFSDFGLTDSLRPLLWERMESVAKNHGLCRLWTDESAPFWKKDVGFAEATEAALQKLPPDFGQHSNGWLMLQLREESASPASLENELALYKEAEAARLETLFRRARIVKTVFTLIAAILFLIGLSMLVIYFKNGRH
jgi:N-acetylglutamate synthase-like GNAT family acetyltransferase